MAAKPTLKVVMSSKFWAMMSRKDFRAAAVIATPATAGSALSFR